MSLHWSRGTGGDDLTVCGTVESHPGFNVDSCYPKPFYAASATPHTKWRVSTCVVCFTVVPRSQWRVAQRQHHRLYLPDNALALAALQRRLPTYSCDLSYMPTSLHIQCLNTLQQSRKAPKWFSLAVAAQHLAAAAQREAAGTPADAAIARSRPCTKECSTCASGGVHGTKWAAQMSSNAPLLHPGLPPPKRAKRTVVVITPPAARISSHDLLAWNGAEGGSIRATARGADSQRERHTDGDSKVDSASGAVLRRDSTFFHRVFSRMFRDVDTTFGSTGGAVICDSLLIFILTICFLTGNPLAMLLRVKLNVDGGRGSVKLMLQLLWSDDPIFGGGDARVRRRGALRDHAGMSDNGGRRTFIVGLIPGGHETFASVRFLLDRYDFLEIRRYLPAECQIICPVDMKMGALFAGVETSGSLHPQPCTLLSLYDGHSRPDSFRTSHTILVMLGERRKAEAVRGRPFKTGIAYESVGAEPIRLLQELFFDKPVADCLVPPTATHIHGRHYQPHQPSGGARLWTGRSFLAKDFGSEEPEAR